MNIRILICDDERAFTDRIAQWLEEHQTSNCKLHITVKNNADQVTDDLLCACDLLFLDIDMGEISGMDIARRLRKLKSDAILIFVTNYSEFSPEGYEVSAFRFLLKDQLENKLPKYFAAAIEKLQNREEMLSFQWNGVPYSLPLKNIVYLESRRRTILFHLQQSVSQQAYCYDTLDHMEERLSGSGFLRIHQSLLVNISFIQSVHYDKLELVTGEVLPISQRRYAETKLVYLNWMHTNKAYR